MSKVKRVVVEPSHVSSTSRHATPNAKAEAAREEFRNQLSQYTLEQLVFCDELRLAPKERADWVWAHSQEEADAFGASSPEVYEKYILIALFTVDGISCTELYHEDSAWSRDTFLTWLKKTAMPTMNAYPQPKSVLVIDKSTPHRQKDIRDICKEHSVEVVIMPTGSQAMNPMAKAYKKFRKELGSYKYSVGRQNVAVFPNTVTNAMKVAMNADVAKTCFEESGIHEEMRRKRKTDRGDVESEQSDRESDKENATRNRKSKSKSKTTKSSRKKTKSSKK